MAPKIDSVAERLEGDERLRAFAEVMLRRVPPGITEDPADLAARVTSLFSFIERRPDPVAVRAFNPAASEHGYESEGTILEFNVADTPFLLDSVTNEIEAFGVGVSGVIHPVVGVERDDDGLLTTATHPRDAVTIESVQHYELDRRLFEADLPGLEAAVRRVLGSVAAAVADFEALRARAARMARYAREATGHVPSAEIDEAEAFLDWLVEDNFVFLGYREYRIFETPDGRAVEAEAETGLGILRDVARSASAQPLLLSSLNPETARRYTDGDVLVITKTNSSSPVHRRVKMDYVGVRIFGDDGSTVGEARMLGLFTSKAYMEPAARTPILRRKLSDIVVAEDLIEGSHDYKALVALFDGFSKHDLFSAATEELRETLSGMLAIQEREHVSLFVRRDLLQRNVSVLVSMPRDRFNADLRRRLQDLVKERFAGSSIDYHLALGESTAAQIHFTVWVEDGAVPEVDFQALEAEVREVARSWTEQLADALDQRIDDGDRVRALVDRWGPHLPDYYRSSTAVAVAAGDVLRLEDLAAADRPFVVGIQNEAGGGSQPLTRIALYRKDGKRPLSELLPALEALGLAVVEEVPTRLQGIADHVIHDFGVLDRGAPLDLGRADLVAEAVGTVWGEGAPADNLDRLVVVAGLRRSQVDILRAYRTYWRRVAPVFTMGYVNDTLVEHPGIAVDLVRLFEMRFDPDAADAEAAAALADSIVDTLDAVPSIEQDRILRSFLRLIQATLRTNAYVENRAALVFKFRSPDVPDAPLPLPMAEIFVLSHEVEGIHLRGGMVARGGLRWSTRREDYRTEVLGLMKAQITKNAVIVPTGAKGGFVLLSPPDDPTALREAVRAGYETFVNGLLDVTDNRVGTAVVHPDRVVVHDGDDPYLVVAADKGTATFSDLANSIAAKRGFWLDDAFASGGSSGYDHKALGITARGAWESLRRHFAEMGLDPAVDEFTAVGIGDMSGDVFGNGMLLSDRLKLVAAFDHRHVFVDPDPDPMASHAERARLFGVDRSSWADYDASLISDGGGVYGRDLKSIDLSETARRALGTDRETVTPAELISIVLKAPVDLLWNGGIGTYVKSRAESNDAAGDRVNDVVRVNGADLRAKAVVEGGNLGLTQAGRIEYSLAGGRVNTDFIDNSGGVDCSDREVNLKILLGLAVESGELDSVDRDGLIAAVSDDVVARILRSNRLQAALLTREQAASASRMESYEELMVALEQAGLLNRQVEGLPGPEEMAERVRDDRGVSRPELAVLLAYAKRWVRQVVVRSSVSESSGLVGELAAYFPETVADGHTALLDRHPLRRELVATLVANDIVNSQGVVFVSRLSARTGSDPAEVVAAYLAARQVAGSDPHRRALDDVAVGMDVWLRMNERIDDMIGALTRWYLRNPGADGLGKVATRDEAAFADLERALVSGHESWRPDQRRRFDLLMAAGVNEDLARYQAVIGSLASGPDLIEVSRTRGIPPADVLEYFVHGGRAFGIDRLAKLVADAPVRSLWERWAIWAIEEDLLGLRRLAAERSIDTAPDAEPGDAVQSLLDTRPGTLQRLERFLAMVEGGEPDIAALTVAVRQLRAAIA